MTRTRPYKHALDLLQQAGLRPTRQRLALARILFDGQEKHVTAEQLHAEAMTERVSVSLATVYNTLHQFTTAKLLSEVVVEPGRSYFDTNTDYHHHFFHEKSGLLRDIPQGDIELAHMPSPPDGKKVARVDIVVRLEDA